MTTVELQADVTALLVHEYARETIRECHDHATNVATVWGQLATRLSGQRYNAATEWSRDCVKSWSMNLSWLFTNTFDNTQEIFKDGDLSFYIRSAIHMGLIFHRAHRDVPLPLDGDIRLGRNTALMGRYCGAGLYETPDGSTDICTLALDHEGHCPTHGEASYVLALPIPGTWSMHS